MGQYFPISRARDGELQRQWIENIPNDGLIYYPGALNAARVMITCEKGSAEVLVQRPYDFPKSTLLRDIVGEVIGLGLVFAEGQQHKVGGSSVMECLAMLTL
jgi:hypothetical protein